MTDTESGLWSDVLGQVRLSHPALVRGWFSDLRISRVDGGTLEITSANRAQCRYLQQHCQAALTEAAQAATGRLVSVNIETDAEDSADFDAARSAYGSVDEQLQLNPDCTFDNFVVGPCNRLAHAAALAVTEDPGKAYNPLFVYGPVGLGKTHLLQAINHRIRERNPKTKFHYISCETFINRFMEGVEQGALHQFRYRYRHVDGLVIDDVQFLAERERSQEEFFHTFNALHQSQRQLILSADCSPSDIPSLEERLVSRFKSGLVALMDRPCLETRIAIVMKKAKLRCIEISEPVARLIASRIDSNIRELEGALLAIDALSQVQGGAITLEIAQEAVGGEPLRPVTISTILDIVASRFHLKVSDLQSKKRSKMISHPRQISMFLARQLTPLSLEQIGGYFGGRDHTTVLHGSRAIAQQAEDDPQLAGVLEELTVELKNAPG